MYTAAEIDAALGAITKEYRYAANDVLDLREAALERNDPGLCMQCYFKIYGASTRRDPEALKPLRDWLETHVEIVARDHYARELERLPLQLETDSLEAFCHEMMTEFRDNRAYHHTPNIELTFQFKDLPEVA